MYINLHATPVRLVLGPSILLITNCFSLFWQFCKLFFLFILLPFSVWIEIFCVLSDFYGRSGNLPNVTKSVRSSDINYKWHSNVKVTYTNNNTNVVKCRNYDAQGSFYHYKLFYNRLSAMQFWFFYGNSTKRCHYLSEYLIYIWKKRPISLRAARLLVAGYSSCYWNVTINWRSQQSPVFTMCKLVAIRSHNPRVPTTPHPN